MLDREQRRMIMDLFSDGMGVSEIARKVGVSRQSVYRVIQSDFEEDTEIHALKKRVRKAKLRGKLHELREPLKRRSELANMQGVVDRLISWVLALWYLNPDLKPTLGDAPPRCLYCGNELEYVEREDVRGILPEYVCHQCRKVFPFP